MNPGKDFSNPRWARAEFFLFRPLLPSGPRLDHGPERRNPDSGVSETPALIGELRQAQRSLAAEHGCAFFDTMAWQGGPGAVDRWLVSDPPLERDDRIHFTERGYRRLGIGLLRAIGRNLRHGEPLP